MFQRFGESMRRFMSGRNGTDQLGLFLLIAGLALSIISTLAKLPIFSMLAYIPLLLAVFRIFSRNVSQRYAENRRFCQFFARIKGRKQYRYFRCPSCRTQVRVPKGKGTLRITCPSCHERFIKKT